MKKYILFSLFLALFSHTVAQTAVDTLVTLQHVEVKGRHFSGLSGGEMKRLHVENNISSQSLTAADALRQLPSLHTDIEGGIMYRGSSRTSVLLHRTPYGWLEEQRGDLLIQLPALFFNRIEVFSYPPVSWVPDGEGGILNITSENDPSGSRLRLMLGGGWNERYNAAAALHLHPGKWHVLARYNYRREYRERSFSKQTTTPGGTTEMNNSASARPDIHLADMEIGYDLTAHDRLSVYGLYHLMEYDRYGGIRNTRRNSQGEVMNRMLRHRFNHQKQGAYGVESRWKHTFAYPADHLEIAFNYNNFVYDEDNDYQNENPLNGKIVAQDNLFIRQQKDNYYWRATLRKSIGNDFVVQAGYVGRYKKEHYESEAANLLEGTWKPNAQKTDDYRFNRLTQMVYGAIGKSWEMWSAEIGVQAEHSRQEVREERTNRFHLYPRARLSYQPDERSKYQVSYQQRTIRPLGAELNTFIDYSDATHLVQGNPDLKDEIIHSLEAGYSLDLPHFRLSPALYYRNRRKRIMDMLKTNQEETVWQKQNVGSGRQFGAEATASWNPVHALTVSLSGNIFRDEIDGRTIGYDARKSMICWDTKSTVTVQITPDTELQVDGFFLSDQLTAQGKIKKRSAVNAGISQYLLGRSLRLNLSVNNIFDTLKETTLIDTDGMTMKQVRNRDARVGWLMLSYVIP